MSSILNGIIAEDMIDMIKTKTMNFSTSAGSYITDRGVHDVYGYFICLALLVLYDLVIARGTKGRWFHIHAVANAVTVVFALPAMYQWITKPLSVGSYVGQESPDPLGANWSDFNVLFHPSNDRGILMILAVHTYHCIAFDLSAQDIFHHLMFVPTIGVYGGFFVKWGPIRNCLAFFISGLPGGVDYVNLALMKNDLMSKLTVKRYASIINVWIRGPGCGVLIPATMYLHYTEDKLDPGQGISALSVSLFSIYNGLYYMDMAVKNYQMHLTRMVLEKTHTEELEKMENYWQQKENATVQRQPTIRGASPLAGNIVDMLISTSPGAVRKNKNL